MQMRRILALSLACLMLFGTFTGMASADELPETEPSTEPVPQESEPVADAATSSEGKSEELPESTEIPEASDDVADETEAEVQDTIPVMTEATESAVPEETMQETNPTESAAEEIPTEEVESSQPEFETTVPEATEDACPEKNTNATEPDVPPLDNELEVGDTLVPAYTLDPNRPMLMSAGNNITITRKVHFGIPETEYWWRSSIMGYKNGRWWTSAAQYFELSDGRIGFCIQPSYDGPVGDVPALSPGGQYVDSDGWPAALGYSNGSAGQWIIDQTSKTAVARILAVGAPNNGDWSAAALEATALAIWDAATGYMNPNGTWRWGLSSGAFYANTWGERDTEYKKILDKLAHFDDIPSFTSRNSSNAPAYEMTYHPNTKMYDILLTDTNGVLDRFNFSVPSELAGKISFTKHGNSLHVTVTAKGLDALRYGMVHIQNVNRGINIGTDACTVYGNGLRSQKVVVLDRPLDPVPCYFNLYAKPISTTGTVKIVKSTNTGGSLGGWKFGVYTDSNCSNPVSGSPFTTDSAGLITTDLEAGTYYVKELDSGLDYWYTDNTVKSVTISSGATASVSFYNVHHGKLQIRKTTNTGSSLGGWKFGIYTDPNYSNPVSGSPFITDSAGLITTDLEAGTYYVKELDSGLDYWYTDNTVKSVTVSNGSTGYVSFNNIHHGKLQIRKTTNTGSSLGGWKFGVYTDSNCSNPVPGSPFITDSAGLITTDLEAGTYYVKELDSGLEYWYTDNTVKSVTVSNGSTGYVSFNNVHHGKLQIQKTTNTGHNLEGWSFGVYTDSGCNNPVAGSPFTTNDSGLITTDLTAGTYYVKELTPSSGYWEVDSSIKEVTVKNGDTATVNFSNVHYGRLKVIKNAINGSAKDWIFDVYQSDGTIVATLTTDDSGNSTTGNLLPGTYTVKERHDENRDYYWTYDVEAEKVVEINPGETAEVSFTNIENGRIKIKKALETDDHFDYPLNIWQFEIKDPSGVPIDGSPFTTDGNGEIITGQLAPGTYTVEELLPEGSAFMCKTEGKVTVNVINGETAEVLITNTLRPGQIGILKVNQDGKPLADAKFALEWSEDEGKTWHPVTKNDQQFVVTGGCNNANLTNDGCLITGPDGTAVFSGLHPELTYRLTEIEAPSGYQLLKDTAWQGKLPSDKLIVSLHVVNYPMLLLPETGANGFTLMGISLGVCFAAAIGAILYFKKKGK